MARYCKHKDGDCSVIREKPVMSGIDWCIASVKPVRISELKKCPFGFKPVSALKSPKKNKIIENQDDLFKAPK